MIKTKARLPKIATQEPVPEGRSAQVDARPLGSEPAVLARRRDLAEDNLREYVARVVAHPPALSSEQKSRLRSLFQASSPFRAGGQQ
jgi:hypothetical protein